MSRRQKFNLYRIILSAVLFFISLILPVQGWLKFVICLVPYIIAGYDVLFEAAANIIQGQVFDEKFLMAIASIGAFAVGEYHEAVFVMIFFQIGELFESIAVGKSRKSVAALMEICPEYANIERDGQIVQAPPEDICIGDIIIIKPGERIPLDGHIIEGASSLNTSALTGEAIPRDVQVGDDVVSGCVNLSGTLKVCVSKVFSDSTVSRILELVEQSAASKSKSENFITQFARWYTPVVVICAVILAVLPPIFIGQWAEWIHRALTFLVISCPCALVISVPLTYFGGIGKASRNGILVKGSNYLDALARCDSFVFDKTGTLTRGSFSVKDVNPVSCSAEELLELAAYAESYSNHPIAQSILSAWKGQLQLERLSEVSEEAGFGVCALLDGKCLLAGNARLIEKHGINYVPASNVGTAIYVAHEDIFRGSIIISDEIKSDSTEALTQIKALGNIKTYMLTGDDEMVGQAVGRELGIDKVYSKLLPQDKVKILEQLLEEKNGKGTLAFVGDGMNDAPSLSRADVGIAMGAFGSDAAIEASDVVLMDDKPSKVPLAVSIARKTRVIVMENIAFSLIVKFGVLILGALGYAGMWAAAFADVGVCVIAILNAMRTLK